MGRGAGGKRQGAGSRGRGARGWEQGAGSRERRAKNAKEIVYVADPASGLLKYTKDEFCKCWYSTKSDGVDEGPALLLEPTPEFYHQEDEEKSKLNFLYLLGYIRPYTRFILQLMLGMLTASIISLILPFLTQALVDTGIGNSNMAIIEAHASLLFFTLTLTLTLFPGVLNNQKPCQAGA